MKRILQPNGWTCLPTSFAMVLNMTLGEVYLIVGHDGSDIIWPDILEPDCRRNFHIQEMINLAYARGYAVTPFEALPNSAPYTFQKPHVIEYDVEKYMHDNRGVLTGLNHQEKRHAVAWDGRNIIDPNGYNYSLEDFSLETFWMVSEIKSTEGIMKK